MANVEIANVSFCYPKTTTLILDGLDLTIADGEFVCVLGRSGCGKSTLLRLVAGLEQPTSGTVKVDGEIVQRASLDRGVVFQDYGLFPWMTAGKNIMLPLKRRYPDKSKQEHKQIALDMITAVGLEESVFNKYPKELSGGMKQRCAIAQAFAIDPPILLMDEPFGALDAVTRARLQEMVLELWGRLEVKKTVLFVTHDVDEALLLANRVVVLGQSPSSVIYECTLPDELKTGELGIFESPEMLRIRNELVSHINKDVLQKASS